MRTLLAVAIVFLANAAAAIEVSDKRCIIAAAQKLPPVPGLKITGSTSSAGGDPLLDQRTVVLEVEAAAQKMRFAFICTIASDYSVRAELQGILD